MAVELNKCTFDAMLVKPKSVWEALYFQFSKMFDYNFLKKCTASLTHVSFTNMGPNKPWFSSIAIYFQQVSIGTPCKDGI